ncbi:MAG TPA: hypothetical protein VK752_26375 [Bryobacteraceae bacterium]|nr:hypothetical protein [Bryobacteraceae bacterium]
MKLQTVESALAAMMSLVMLCSGAAPVIGTVVAKGAFRLDNATVTGNATLFEGATIETGNAASRVELSSGARISLATDSKARFFGDHMILEKGEGRLEKAEGFRFEARGLTIQPETGNAAARVAIEGVARVELAATSGSFRVLNSRGVLVANLGSGHALELEPQAKETATKLTGTLHKTGQHYLLTDETTNVTVELAGPGLAKEAGSRVEVTGQLDPTATPVTDASQFVRVSAIQHLGKGAAGNSGAAAAGKGGAVGAAHGVAFSATTIAIVAGVAAAATLGGLAAAGKLPGQGSSSVSR